jgi:hypothetical protein
MNYSSYSAAVAALDFYANQKKIPPSKLVLGVAFFGSSEDDSHEESYKNILAAYSMPGKSIWWTWTARRWNGIPLCRRVNHGSGDRTGKEVWRDHVLGSSR